MTNTLARVGRLLIEANSLRARTWPLDATTSVGERLIFAMQSRPATYLLVIVVAAAAAAALVAADRQQGEPIT